MFNRLRIFLCILFFFFSLSLKKYVIRVVSLQDCKNEEQSDKRKCHARDTCAFAHNYHTRFLRGHIFR